jgi:hypothetical protein
MEDFKNTPFGKGVRTAYQTLLALAPFVVMVLAIPEFQALVRGEMALGAAAVPILAGVFAWLMNKAGK